MGHPEATSAAGGVPMQSEEEDHIAVAGQVTNETVQSSSWAPNWELGAELAAHGAGLVSVGNKAAAAEAPEVDEYGLAIPSALQGGTQSSGVELAAKTTDTLKVNTK